MATLVHSSAVSICLSDWPFNCVRQVLSVVNWTTRLELMACGKWQIVGQRMESPLLRVWNSIVPMAPVHCQKEDDGGGKEEQKGRQHEWPASQTVDWKRHRLSWVHALAGSPTSFRPLLTDLICKLTFPSSSSICKWMPFFELLQWIKTRERSEHLWNWPFNRKICTNKEGEGMRGAWLLLRSSVPDPNEKGLFLLTEKLKIQSVGCLVYFSSGQTSGTLN